METGNVDESSLTSVGLPSRFERDNLYVASTLFDMPIEVLAVVRDLALRQRTRKRAPERETL